MPTTDQDLRALAYLAKRLREETHGANRWDEAGIHAVVAKLAGRNLAVTIEQVARHAADPEAKTPGAINRPFLPEPTKSERVMPPKPSEACATCGRRDSEHTGAYGDHEFVPLSRATEGRSIDGAELVRSQLRSAAAALCSHGVPHATCAEHRPSRKQESSKPERQEEVSA